MPKRIHDPAGGIDVIAAMRQRASTRAFQDREVPREVVEAILDAARWAPSGVNIQPWRVEIVTGAVKDELGDAMIAAKEAGQPDSADYRYYPESWFEPYKSRRKACGLAMYGALGIGREDRDKQKAAWNRNYRFFGAPVGLLFFIDRELGQGAWIDTGMFLQNVMLAALGFGLATCPQASLAEYPAIARQMLDVEERYALVCGMALGHADREAAVNGYRTEREPVEAFTTWHG